MNQKGGIWAGALVLLLGVGLFYLYVTIFEPFFQAFATSFNISGSALLLISGIGGLILLIALYFAFAQNTNLPWWAGGGRVQ